MRALAEAILARRDETSFRRCAVAFDDHGHCLLWSPRNSEAAGMVPPARADDLARLILETIPPTPDGPE